MLSRVVAIHDISCVGKCSLTIALPVLSAAGIECSVLPTAILSTHTGGFSGYTFHDLTGEMEPIARHWESLHLPVDAFYTGYLGSLEQTETVRHLIRRLKKEDTLTLVDPAMADNGRLYAGFDGTFVKGMAALCREADVILPNLTEAALLLEEPFRENPSREEVQALLRRLSTLGPKKIILTGVSYVPGKIGAAAYDRESGDFCEYLDERVEGSFHGTGDLFSSAVLAALLNRRSLPQSLAIAARFVRQAIRTTVANGTDRRYGVDFEHAIPGFIREVLPNT